VPITPVDKAIYQLSHHSRELVKVGGSYIELPRFKGECLLKPILQMAGKPVPVLQGEVVVSENPKIRLSQSVTPANEFNEFGGIDQVITLLSKPASNLITFDYESTKLVPYLQPPLTQVEINEGSVRPPHIVNSIAWYHSKKGGLVTVADTKKGITTGKAFHLYRMMATDALGKKIWTDWEILNTSQYGLRIDRKFLNDAAYPVTIAPIGDTFGYTAAGGTAYWYGGNQAFGAKYTAPADGTCTSLTMSVRNTDGVNDDNKGLLVLQSDLTIVANGIGNAVTGTSSQSWKTSPFGTPPTIVNATVYYLMNISNSGAGDVATYYDAGDANQAGLDNTNNYASPANLGSLAFQYAYKVSHYITYTAGAVEHEKSLSDSLSISDSPAKTLGKIESDSMVIAESLIKTIGKVEADSFSISDSIGKGIGVINSETLAIVDSVSKAISKTFADNFLITDSIAKAFSKVRTDAMSIADSIITSVPHVLNLFDTLVITDSLSKTIGRIVNISRISVQKLGIARTPLWRYISRRFTA